eukprot:TRINITY_DN15753_c0_g1_i1.p1 TRINITY_DN15753_c0_g1~~TRINITY_DN15753_c0_g1_i1.p1  ORF type:complete len:222 (+),score=48.49 TRINITY_DN15753_c0_g1_i1:63-728(+)
MDNWLREYKDLVIETQEIDGHINQLLMLKSRDRYQTIKGKIEALYTRIKMLGEDLESMKLDKELYVITDKELNRRTMLLNVLYNNADKLQTKFGQVDSNSFQQPKNPRRVWGELNETEETMSYSNDQLLDYQENRIKEQDKSLDVLSQSISRTKLLAYDVNDEINSHLDILDEMEPRVERTTRKVRRATDKTYKLQKKASTCSLWLVIFILLLIIIVLVLV